MNAALSFANAIPNTHAQPHWQYVTYRLHEVRGSTASHVCVSHCDHCWSDHSVTHHTRPTSRSRILSHENATGPGLDPSLLWAALPNSHMTAVQHLLAAGADKVL